VIARRPRTLSHHQSFYDSIGQVIGLTLPDRGPKRANMTSSLEIAELPDEDFWEIEFDRDGPFRWSRPQFSLKLPSEGRKFVGLLFACNEPHNALRLRADEIETEIPLLEGWQRIDVPTLGARRMHFSVSHPHRPGLEQRTLGIRIRAITCHDDQHVHEVVTARHANAVLNHQEYERGAEIIRSAPPLLRITISKSCNIANEIACVYCSWDWAKRLEEGSPDFSLSLLKRMGRYFYDALEVNDCSYGEPPLEAEFGDVLDMITDAGRTFEFTSNGQSLGKKIRSMLIGKPVRIYVSIDAAIAASYKRYRDSRFDLILRNLRDLCAERDGQVGTPEVIVSFIVMRSNVDEIDSFVRLMRLVGIDRVCFRTLDLEHRLEEQTQMHYGFKFDYQQECLTARELHEVARRCLRAGSDSGLGITIEWDAFVASSSPANGTQPLCSEPWKTAYVLNRGFMPCCYGRDPLVRWDEIDVSKLETAIEQALNSSAFRELRNDLAGGRLGRYCRATTGCPIVKQRAPAPL
jgi:molybdenum cofactor biosynthesis enzyme MoaA